MKKFSLFLILFLSFSSFSQMVMDGTATGGCDCYTLTTTTSQAGSIWSPSTISLDNPFDFTFRVNLGSNDAWGADGIAFVLRQSGTSTGTGGSGLGYQGIANSIAVEIDTWNSGIAWAAGDIPDDHIGMHSNGLISHNLEPAVSVGNVEDGLFHDFRVTWSPDDDELTVYFDGTLIFTHVEDLRATIFGGSPDVYFGWTGSTGGASNVQQVCIDVDAEFDIDDTFACPDQELFLTDLSSTGLIYDGVEITSWSWLFSGGSTSTDPNPSIIFPTIGTKTIQLTVTNMIGCSSVVPLNITVDSIDVDISGTDVICFDDDNGTVIATPLTGDAPYTYLWDDPSAQTTATATGLGPGTYTVTVTDNVGCSIDRTVTITEPTLLELDYTSMEASCGEDDAEITISASGGSPDYFYSIDGGASLTVGTVFTDLSAGTYTLLIEDDNGCQTDSIIDVNSNDLDVDISGTDVTCFGFDDGSATSSPVTGSGPWSYLWDDPFAQTTATASSLSPGTYTVTITHDVLGCSGTATIDITEPDLLQINAVAVTNASCGINNGILSIEGFGGTTPYDYSIDGGASTSVSPTFTDLAPGDYSIELTDAYGCTATDNATIINVSVLPDIIINSDVYSGCEDLEVNLVNVSDPTLTDVTVWTLEDGTTFNGPTFNHTFTEPGCHDISVEITTFDGCLTSETFEDFICVWVVPEADFSFTPNDPNILTPEVTFINESVNADTYHWTLGNGSASTDINPTTTYPNTGGENYLVELIAYTDLGCSDTIYKYVTIEEVIIYFIPNTFTPNGDSYNNDFQPVFEAGFIPFDYHFQIFNRWGELVWESYDQDAAWDGTYNGIVADGVYTWRLSFKENLTDVKHEQYGHVTILK